MSIPSVMPEVSAQGPVRPPAGAGAAGLTLRSAERQLWYGDAPLPLDASGYAVLATLIDYAGMAVPQTALLALLGERSESALFSVVATVNTTLASHAAGAGYIAHYPELGYALMLPYIPGSLEPPACMRLIGRDAELAAIAGRLASHRFVSIVGPGGIGKTSLARSVVASQRARNPDGCITLDLAPMTQGQLLPAALVAALGLAVASPAHGAERHFAALGPFLRGRTLLVILDSCEHVIDAAAAAAEALLKAAPGVSVLATSREPLRADGEFVHRLGPIDTPAGVPATAAEALRSAAVRLFAERAFADGGLADEQAAAVAALCRDLDGIPLALELAAALVTSRGLDEVAAQASRRLLAAAPLPPGTSPRHASLEAMLDWSYDLLSEHERRVFARLSVFRASFTLQGAAAVAGGADLDELDVVDIVVALIAKSLICSASSGSGSLFRLLDTTRAYAVQRLDSAGERQQVNHVHARFIGVLLDEAHAAWLSMPRAVWLAKYAPWLDDVRQALDWTFGPEGDPMLGLALVSTSFPLAEQAGAVHEFALRVEQALGVIAGLPAAPPLLRMRLAGYARDSLGGPAVDLAQTLATLAATLQQAEATGSGEVQSAPLTALWGFPFTRGRYPESMQASHRISEAARELHDPVLALIGQRTRAQSLHFMGRHEEASLLAHDALGNSWRRIPLMYAPSPVEIGTSMRIILARTLWIQGLPEQAAQMCADAMASARNDRPVALCQVVALAAVPLALWGRDLSQCESLMRLLEGHAQRYSFGLWQAWTGAYRDVLSFLEPVWNGSDAPLEWKGRDERTAKHADHFATFDVRLLTRQALERVNAGQVGWCAPEVLRARAEQLLEREPVQADTLLRQALRMAARQGALAWELRSATSLATLLQRRDERAQARSVLEPVLVRYREGRNSADVQGAAALLGSL
jgi:predicted ATPase